ncbi:hypothetical protein B0H14DRAFT_3658115 [Mycena olivaceomarginata]|nr:hypothetical protein B0H14DRAFT_3658115 [Mycena olivaceomarginata]
MNLAHSQPRMCGPSQLPLTLVALSLNFKTLLNEILAKLHARKAPSPSTLTAPPSPPLTRSSSASPSAPVTSLDSGSAEGILGQPNSNGSPVYSQASIYADVFVRTVGPSVPPPTVHTVAVAGTTLTLLEFQAVVSLVLRFIRTWARTIEKVDTALEQWELGKPTMEGRHLIILMVVGGMTQYMAKVQGDRGCVRRAAAERGRPESNVVRCGWPP